MTVDSRFQTLSRVIIVRASGGASALPTADRDSPRTVRARVPAVGDRHPLWVDVYIPVMSADSEGVNEGTPTGASVVLLTLAAAQFLMTLDTSVMNVSIATVAKDVGTTVTGIQTAITMYTLVMAAFMITGGKI